MPVNIKRVLARRTNYPNLWHMLDGAGAPRCGSSQLSVYGLSGWETKPYEELTREELEHICWRCGQAKNWVTYKGLQHLERVFEAEVKSGYILSSGRLMGVNQSSDWMARSITQKQLDLLGALGARSKAVYGLSRGEASSAIDWLTEKKYELQNACARARHDATDEQDIAFVLWEEGRYIVRTKNDLLYVYEQRLEDCDIVETFKPELDSSAPLSKINEDDE